MLGKCNFVSYNGFKCNKTFNLHNVIFRDPYTPAHIEMIDLCVWHHDGLVNELTERIKDFQLKLLNLISEQAKLRKIAKEYNTYYKNDMLEKKIEDLRELIKRISNNECKNYFCVANLRELPDQVKLYSVHTFKPSGRRYYTFYYCSRKCFNIMKGKCGISVSMQVKQQTLNI